MRKKWIMMALVAVFLFVLLCPIRGVYKDGGSVVYQAITYTVIRYHRLSDPEDIDAPEFIEGLGIKILGFTITDMEDGYLGNH